MRMSQDACPDSAMSELTTALAQGDLDAMEQLDGLIERFPGDARLHFLRGSVLASDGQFDAGREAMRHAIALAPGYDLARFQLGLLELSSGDAGAAEATLGPLLDLDDNNYLRLFAEGLGHLVRDEFDACRRVLVKGMAINQAIPKMNEDMQILLDQLPASPDQGGQAETSETQMLLQSLNGPHTQH